MKQQYLYFIGIIAIVGIISCAKERAPELRVHVQEAGGAPAVGASVHAWPGNDTLTGQTGSGIRNDAEMDKTGTTDANGDVTFNFKYSVVLDVDVVYIKSSLDTAMNTVNDTLYGSKVVKIESVRQRSKENVYNESIVVQ
ncbi:MAG: hypothetical protein J5I47_04385 [Vicingus serpentipes]|nr:hypothetical protein [Vicingus serpentipes]